MSLYTYVMALGGGRSMVYLSSCAAPRHRMKVTRCRAPSLMIHEAVRIAAAQWRSGKVRAISGGDLRRLKYVGQFQPGTGQVDLSEHEYLLVNDGSYIVNSGAHLTVESLEKNLLSWSRLMGAQVSWSVPRQFHTEVERDAFLADLIPW